MSTLTKAARGQVKQRKCKVCRQPFQIFNSLVKTCSVDCGMAWLDRERQRKAKRAELDYRSETRKLKEKIKTLEEYEKDAEKVFNQYIKLRDWGRPCVSCDKPHNGQHQRHASHFRSVGNCKALRYNLKNVHTSCAQCNTMKSGNLLEYRIRLVRRFGEDFVQYLESVNNPRRYTIEYLKRLKKIFAKKCKRMQRRIEESSN